MSAEYTPFRIDRPIDMVAWVAYQAWQNEEASYESIYEGAYQWTIEDESQRVAQLGQWFTSTPKAVISNFENLELLVTYHDPRFDFSATHKIIDIFKALAKHPLKSPAHAYTTEDAYKFATDLLSNRNNMLVGVKKDCLDIVKYCPHFMNIACATNVLIGFFLQSMLDDEELESIDMDISDQRKIEDFRSPKAFEMCQRAIIDGTCDVPMGGFTAFDTVIKMIHDLLDKYRSPPSDL